MAHYLTAAFYKFVALPDYVDLKPRLLDYCLGRNTLGTILLATEGINGTIAGQPDDVRAVLDFLRADPRLANLTHKESFANEAPFYRMKVRLKREIVTLGAGDIDPANNAGTYVAPQDWNALISDPDVLLIDARNDYEVSIGSFEGAQNPGTTNFRDLPAWLDANPQIKNKPKIAMFCTGGIRCEKSTAYLRSQGLDEVYHLQGGILKYLEEVPEQDSKWQGECFVFDERVSVGHGLKPGPYDLCRACRHPLSEQDKQSPNYVVGVSCGRCFDQHSAAQKERYRERQKQMELAEQRNQPHLGASQQKNATGDRPDE